MRTPPPDTDDRYRLIRPSELAEPVEPMEWLIRGIWPLGSFGPLGGAKKTLKTYIASVLAIAVASGRPAFNNPEWAVPEARPVIYYGGEGGREMHKRRLQRIARDVYGISDLGTLPLYLVTDIGPFDRPEFWEALRRNVREVNATRRKRTKVGLVVLDSLYNYHPADVEVSNLYERGRLLAGLSAPLVDRGIALWVVDHFNKTGSGIDLDRLAQSGMSAWADSWMLFEHAAGSPDVPNGAFSISTGIGSRQWGGEDWTLHLDIGPFDKETGGYLTAMKVEAHQGITKRGSGSAAGDPDVAGSILKFITGHPNQTRTDVVKHTKAACGVGQTRVDDEFDTLVASARIRVVKGPHREGNRTPIRDVCEVVSESRSQPNPATELGRGVGVELKARSATQPRNRTPRRRTARKKP